MDLPTLLMIALMGGAVYFLMIRPQQKRTKEQKDLMSSMEPSSRVMTISGIVGTIRYLGEKQIILEISPGVEMTMDKRAISPQAVVDEFEYADDAEPRLIDEPATTEPAMIAEPTAPEALVAEPAEDLASTESDLTDGPTWDSPGTSKN